MLSKLGLTIFGILATLYIAIFLILRYGQNRFIFLPNRQIRATPQKYGLDYQEVWLRINRDRVHGWWIPTLEPTAPALLYFHGNASNNGDLMEIAVIFRQLGLSVLLIDYRGYGKSSPIFPNETRAYEDAETAWQYLTNELNIEPERIFVYGHSLGGAIAIELATKYPEMAGLIIEGTFTSIKDMASLSSTFKIFPLNLLITQRFDSISKIQSLETPLLILHGTADEIIPLFMSDALYNAASEPKQLEIFSHAGHNNLPTFAGKEYLLVLERFIQSNLTSQ